MVKVNGDAEGESGDINNIKNSNWMNVEGDDVKYNLFSSTQTYRLLSSRMACDELGVFSSCGFHRHHAR